MIEKRWNNVDNVVVSYDRSMNKVCVCINGQCVLRAGLVGIHQTLLIEQFFDDE
jgi:hypothetical protein